MGEPGLGWPIWIGIVVDDIERQRAFYRDALGLREVRAGEGWAWFDLGWPRVLELLLRDPSDPMHAERRFQVGFEVADVRVARDELIARGVEAVGEVEGGPRAKGYWASFRDPEGNVFELTQRLGEPFPEA